MAFSPSALISALRSLPYAVAAWEGGSAANRRADELSDLDLVLVVRDGHVEDAFREIETRLGPVAHRWRVPAPTWHGHAQCFYKLDDGRPFYFLDVVVMTENAANRFLEPERHGTPVVHFDPAGWIAAGTVSADTPDFRAARARRRATLASSLPFFFILVRKEIARRRPVEAMAFFRHLQNALAELLGMKYRPLRYDFGLRYAHVDFPAEDRRWLERVLYVADLGAIEALLPELETKIGSLLGETGAAT